MCLKLLSGRVFASPEAEGGPHPLNPNLESSFTHVALAGFIAVAGWLWSSLLGQGDPLDLSSM